MLLERLTQELSDVPNIEPAHQVETMDFDCPDADVQRRSDLAIGMAQRDQSKDLALARRNVKRKCRAMLNPMGSKDRGVLASCHLGSFQKVL